MAHDDHVRNSEHEHTFNELLRMTENPFHALSDALLSWVYPELYGLKTHGKTLEGKTRTGVPDSYVGFDPTSCSAAVEYTTQKNGLLGKLKRDYQGIRQRCAGARTIVLCTNRCLKSEGVSSLMQKAAKDGVTLHLVDGCALVRCLCEQRQDLRHRFLGIKIDTHTRESLRRTLDEGLDERVDSRVEKRALDRFIQRPHAERAVREATHQHNGKLLMVVAPAGMGKSTWSVNHARRYASIEPVFWSAVADIDLHGTDPISHKIVYAAYGAADPARIIELAELLRRERRTLRVVLDAVDEARDYEALARALRDFRGSKLGKVSNVILTCREGALPLLKDALGPSFRGLFEPGQHEKEKSQIGQVRLEPLDEESARTLLFKEGATATEATILLRALPRQFCGSPFFLIGSLKLARAGRLPSTADENTAPWIDAFANELIEDIKQRLIIGGQGWPARRISKFLAKLALFAIESPSATVTDSQIEGLPDGNLTGENTVLERAIQAGLLVRRSNGVGFSHARFLEYFAADALREEQIAVWVGRLRGSSGREVLGRLIVAHSEADRLLRLLLDHDPEAACDVAGKLGERVADVDLRRAILDVPRGLLISRYLSDHERALSLLKKLHWPEAVRFAIEWWNALPAVERSRSIEAAADLFLMMEVSGEFGIILNHFGLNLSLPWYDVTFVSKVEATSSAFRQSLTKQARDALSADSKHEARAQLVQLLAILRDDWLLQELKKKYEYDLLDGYEHRALLHLNTDASIELYFNSICKCNEWYDAHEDDNGFKHGSERNRRTIMGADVLLFPHDAIARRIEIELNSSIRSRIRTACRWAEVLGDERRLRSYDSARRRLGWRTPRDLIATIAKRSSFEHLANLYEQNDESEIRAAIVSCMDVVQCAESETFLIARLDEPNLRAVAVKALARMGSMRAGNALMNLLKTKTTAEFPHRILIEALGQIGYVPAVQAIGERLQSRDVSFAAATDALGRIGTSAAYRALAAAFERITNVDDWQELLRALLRRREREGIQIVNDLLERFPGAEVALAPAVGDWDIVDIGKRFSSLLPPLVDSQFMAHVVSSARSITASGKYSMGDFHLDGVACCPCSEATQFLEEMAQSVLQGATTVVNLAWQARRLLALRGHQTYEKMMIEEILSHVFERQFVSHLDADNLGQWSNSIVRTILLEHIDRSEHTRQCIDLLRWFALDEDLDLFKRFHEHEDDEIADIAHVYLQHRDAFGRST